MQTDKRNAAKNKHADAKAGKNGGVGGEIEIDGQDRDGQPASKKARLDPDESMGIDRSGLPEGDHTADEDLGEDDGREDEPEDDEDEEEADQEERLEAEEAEEELEEKEAADEALDNGEDSD
jgi:DNA polymerase epsilon subunit 3